MANLFKEYPPGMVLIIVLLLLDGIANLCNSIRSIAAAKKEYDQAVDEQANLQSGYDLLNSKIEKVKEIVNGWQKGACLCAPRGI